MNLSSINNQNQKTNFTAKLKAPRAFWRETKIYGEPNKQEKAFINAMQRIKNVFPEDILVLKETVTPERVPVKWAGGIYLMEDGFFSKYTFSAFNKTKGEKILESDTCGPSWHEFIIQLADKYTGKEIKVKNKKSPIQALMSDLKA